MRRWVAIGIGLAMLAGCGTEEASTDVPRDVPGDLPPERLDVPVVEVDAGPEPCPEERPTGACTGTRFCRYGHAPECYFGDYGEYDCRCVGGTWECMLTRYDCADVPDLPDPPEVVDARDDAAGDDGGGPACTMEDTDAGAGECPSPPPFFQGIDRETFTLFPAALDPTQLHPATSVTYWEERLCDGSGPCQVQRSWGEKCGDAIDPVACAAAFDALQSDSGFDIGCLPSFCYRYLAVNRGDDNFVVDGASLAGFLAPLDTMHEVMYLLQAFDYNVQATEPTEGGYRVVGDGWEVLAKRLNLPCDPITHDRYLLHVAPQGTVTPLCRQLADVLCHACI